MIKHLLLTLFFFISIPFFAFDTKRVDSLKQVLSTANSDTLKINVLIRLSGNYQDSITDLSIEYLNQAYLLAQKVDDKKFLANITNQLGTIYYSLADYEKSLRNFLEALQIYETKKDSKGIANSFNNIGSVFNEQNDYKKGLEYHLKALNIREKNLESGIGDKNEVAQSYANIGVSYYYLNDYPNALDYYSKSLKIAEETGKKNLVALMLNNIGGIYAEQKNYMSALVYFNKSYNIQLEMGNKSSIAMALNNIAEVYLIKHDYNNAIAFYTKGLVIAKEASALDDIKVSYDGMHHSYLEQKNFEKAHEYLLLYNEIKDSIYNTENSAQINEMLTRFDTNKKEQEIQLLQKDKEIHKFWVNSLIIGCILIFLLAMLLYSRNRIKQKANTLLEIKNKDIEQQKKEIELTNNELALKNKEITASIVYAKNIQNAILPPDSKVQKLLPDSFVLYKPKDIVSGDFYFLEEWGNQVLVAAADCTGHGVPGAFMSIVGNNLLQQAINVYGLNKPFLILNNLNKNISKMLNQSEETIVSVKDGMDIALLSIDKTNKHIEFAGAFNPLWIIRNKQLIEIKADKHPVGAFIYEELKQFTPHYFETLPGDILYIFTDGYADQFGGTKGKKFKYKPLQDLLISISDQPMTKQKEILNSNIENWKGNLEQVDDILMIGIKI